MRCVTIFFFLKFYAWRLNKNACLLERKNKQKKGFVLEVRRLLKASSDIFINTLEICDLFSGAMILSHYCAFANWLQCNRINYDAPKSTILMSFIVKFE